MVPQDGFLFDQTIRENVAFGKPHASEEEIQTAFHSLGLTDWLNKLPDGINTQTGSRGERISVGERQLVALARAQLANPGLLILDEATSAVDPETEVALVSAWSVYLTDVQQFRLLTFEHGRKSRSHTRF